MTQPVLDAAIGEPSLVVKLAESLERLGARIHRDLNVEAGETAAPDDQWAATLAEFVEFAGECLTVLDDPRVNGVLAQAAR